MRITTSRKYRERKEGTSRGWPSSRLLLLLLLAATLGAAPACTGFADTVRAENEGDRERGQEAAESLYLAMLEVFEEETVGIDQRLESHYTVVSHYEELSEERRRRFVGRILPVGGGVGVRITAQYQTAKLDEQGEPYWEDEPRELIEQEATPDELRLARRVERRFHQRF